MIDFLDDEIDGETVNNIIIVAVAYLRPVYWTQRIFH